MRKTFLLMAAAYCASLSVSIGQKDAAPDPYRMWTTVKQGVTSTVVAVFEQYVPQEGKVYFARPDGSRFRVSEDFLVREDRQYLHTNHGLALPAASRAQEAVAVPDGLSPEAATQWTLAEKGNAAAQNKLGVLYQVGRAAPQDLAEALKWYRLATNQGDATAQFNLGGMYRDGRGVPQDYAEAVNWYRKAADQGAP